MSYVSWKTGVAAAALLVCLGSAASAATLPAGWTGVGGFGATAPISGEVVTAPPAFGPNYQFVTTAGGVNGVGSLAGFAGTNGSTLTTNLFTANAGDALSFYFNYVTSDGTGPLGSFPDYAWARLLDGIGQEIAILFTARTVTTGDTVPGQNLPGLAPGVTLTPTTTAIQSGTTWAPLGVGTAGNGGSGNCYGAGCGHTGWIQMGYTIGTTGLYQLQFGVTNVGDPFYQSGMAIAGATIAGQPITEVPEPMSLALFGLGLAGLGMVARRRKAA